MKERSIAVAYGSTFGDTADTADHIGRALTDLMGLRPTVADVAYHELRELRAFDVLLLGCSTWNFGELQSDWAARVDELDDVEFRGKQVGLFGMGDQVGYPDTYADALGILARQVEARGAELVGLWPVAGYRFDASLAQRGCCFVGLALDATNQHELTALRIDRWAAQLVGELG